MSHVCVIEAIASCCTYIILAYGYWRGSELVVIDVGKVDWSQVQNELDRSGILNFYQEQALQNS